jgi:hypothetical protein
MFICDGRGVDIIFVGIQYIEPLRQNESWFTLYFSNKVDKQLDSIDFVGEYKKFYEKEYVIPLPTGKRWRFCLHFKE